MGLCVCVRVSSALFTIRLGKSVCASLITSPPTTQAFASSRSEIVGMKGRDGVRYKESKGGVNGGFGGDRLVVLMERGDKDVADGCAVILVASARKLDVCTETSVAGHEPPRMDLED